MINEVLCIILITSIWCVGITLFTQNGFLLYFIRKYAESKVGKYKIWNGLLLCIWCMAGVHSLLGYGFWFLAKGIDWGLLKSIHIVICGVALLNGILWGIMQALSALNTILGNMVIKIEKEIGNN